MEKLIGNAQLELLGSDEAFAGVSLNPSFVWAKVIVTDSFPNGNKQRVPKEEFANIIKTGLYTPLKMAESSPTDHFEAMGKPIGVFTSLVEDGDRVKALVAFWSREREEDIAELKAQFEQGNPPQVSWELWYNPEVSDTDEEGVQNLRDVSFNGAAIVNNPAYSGRTPIFAFASKEEEENNMDLEQKIKELETLLAEKDSLLAEKEAQLADKETKITELSASQTELEELRTFKANLEAEADKLVKLDAIKEKFAAHNIVKDAEYFEANKDMLLGLEDSALDFMVQELVSFAGASASQTQGTSKIPNLETDVTLKNPKKLAQALKSQKQQGVKI